MKCIFSGTDINECTCDACGSRRYIVPSRPLPRYLHYAIDKHQSSPEFREDFPDWLRENCDDGLDVVVDLRSQQRYFCGEWSDVEFVTQPQSPPHTTDRSPTAQD